MTEIDIDTRLAKAQGAMSGFEVKLSETFLKSVFPDYDFEGDPELVKTPMRFLKMLKELTTPEQFEFTTFPNVRDVDEMVIVQDIPFYTLCAHHIIPFFGVCHIAYIPGDRLAGLSKLPRTVKHLSRGLWSQENLTDSIANILESNLDPIGVGVIMRGEHLCMVARGIEVQGTVTTTSAMRGAFLDTKQQARAEFLSAIGLR